jgi:hypothetical protein
VGEEPGGLSGKAPIQLGIGPEKELLHRELTNVIHLCRQNRDEENAVSL